MTAPPSLSAAAEKLLAQMQLVPPRAHGERLRPIDEATILELAAATFVISWLATAL